MNPKSWKCKHCGERVDPTMEVCWNCGHDREGVPQPAAFVDQVDVDKTRCSACSYDLQGNEDATQCPECGEPVPWQDCPDCGIRSNREAFINGCPACRAMQQGFAFVPEVEFKPYEYCPKCQYDFRGNPQPSSCPECGARIAGGRYETAGLAQKPENDAAGMTGIYRRRAARGLIFFFFGTFALFIAAVIFTGGGDIEIAALLWALFGMGCMFCIICLCQVAIYSLRKDPVDHRQL